MAQPVVCYVTDRKSLALGESPDPAEGLMDRIRVAVQAGVDCVQIREKDLPGRQLLTLVRAAIATAKDPNAGRGARKARIHVNDRLDVALAAGAAGVHLGGQSLPAADVVSWCRGGNAAAQFQIGVSCHGIEAAREAEQSGANYIFFGPLFDTPSKRSFGAPQGIDRLREVCAAVRIPVIAIGGITANNADECIRAGAAGIAAIRLFQEAASVQELEGFIARAHHGA